MNRILNGDFSSGFDYWSFQAYPFTLDSGMAKGISFSDSTDEKTHGMTQEFAIYDEVISADITVWGQWRAYSGNPDGYNNFLIRLQKPDMSYVTLLDTTKSAVIGSGNLLDAQDIKANFDQYGNYKISLILKTASAWYWSEKAERYVYALSFGCYDNISIDVTVKKYKTVHEKLGSSEKLGSKASVSRSEIVGLVEAYSTETFSPTFNYETASESVGLNESYSTLLKRQRGAVEVVGLKETLQAKRTQGNLETTYTITDLTQWEETAKTETPWIKKKIEIPQK